jgi:hypothetical protein
VFLRIKNGYVKVPVRIGNWAMTSSETSGNGGNIRKWFLEMGNKY